MKAFVLAEPGKVKWFDAPEPQLVPYGAILKTGCCDLHVRLMYIQYLVVVLKSRII